MEAARQNKRMVKALTDQGLEGHMGSPKKKSERVVWVNHKHPEDSSNPRCKQKRHFRFVGKKGKGKRKPGGGGKRKRPSTQTKTGGGGVGGVLGVVGGGWGGVGGGGGGGGGGGLGGGGERSEEDHKDPERLKKKL